MHYKNKRFSNKLLAVLLIMSLLPSLFVAVFSGLAVDRILQQHLVSESTKVVKNGMYSIDRLIDRYVEAVDRLSENPQLNRLLSEYSDDQPQLTEGLVAEIFQNMYQVLQTFHSTSDIHLLHSGSKAALSLRDLPSIYDLPANSDWGAFYSANHSQETIVKPSLYTNSRHTVMAVTVMRAIRAQGSILGYVAMDIPLEVIRNELIGSHQLLPINFTLMSKFNYALFNDAALPSYAQFISWKGRELTKKAGYVVEPVDDYHLLIPFFPSEKYNLVLLGSINIDLLLGRFSVVSSILLIMALTSLAFFAVISLLVTKRITQPLQTIVTSMHGIEEGNFDQRVLLPQEDEFGYLAAQFNVMCEKIKDLFQKDREKQESLRVAELKNLQAQINPHFLCNTLDSVKWLAKLHHDKQIYDMVRHLCLLLKSGMSLSNEFLTVGEVMKNLQSYIALQQIRFPNKFNIIVAIDNAVLDCLIPNFLLQPLVENAMLHGLEAKTGNGTLRISGQLQEELLQFQVQDDGVGMDTDKLSSLIASLSEPDSSQHVGLRNVNRRIKLYYGEPYGLQIKSVLHVGSEMTITLPYKDILEQENR